MSTIKSRRHDAPKRGHRFAGGKRMGTIWKPDEEQAGLIVPMVSYLGDDKRFRVRAMWHGKLVVARSINGCAWGLLRIGAPPYAGYALYEGSFEGTRIDGIETLEELADSI